MVLLKRSMSSKVNILWCLFLIMGCGPTKLVTESQRDSVIMHVVDSVVFRDTVVLVEVPQESDKALIPDTDTSYLQTSIAESWAYAKDGKLHHSLRNKCEMILPVKVQYRDRARIERSDHISWKRMAETIEVEKQLSRWQNLIMSLGYAVLISVVAWLVWKLSKIIRL